MKFPNNIHAFADYIRALQLSRMADYYGVRFEQGNCETRRALGLHVNSPDQCELDNAVAKAEKEGYETIFVYAS